MGEADEGLKPKGIRGLINGYHGLKSKTKPLHCKVSSTTPVEMVEENPNKVKGDSFIRLHLRKLSPYQPILPFEVGEALGAMKFPYIYPDPKSRRLCAALAADSGLDADYILAGCGADELIDLIMRCVLDPGDKILDCPPTFTMYEFDAAVNGALVIKGLAGLRVGYGAFPLSLIQYIWRAKQPYNVSVAAEVSAYAALQNPGYLERVKNALVQERERLFDLLKEVPFLKLYPSYSNFILCEVASGKDAKKLKVFLLLIMVFISPKASIMSISSLTDSKCYFCRRTLRIWGLIRHYNNKELKGYVICGEA
ncbi:hypothetical protein QJS10_CPA16g01713 [Acorus calamus]|uniref:histidinol-phosphate transaminase n=1 Tax=Acorus calamus TaxID=4465 RepID=A0AAV9CYM8_ACOCL|nr:hypothetical protein QJS10_CPA16g01713 [Acorus calamus]